MALKYDLNGGSGTAPTVGTLYGGYKASYHYTDKGTGVRPPRNGPEEWNTKADGSGVGVVPGKGLDLSAFLEDGLKELTLYRRLRAAVYGYLRHQRRQRRGEQHENILKAIHSTLPAAAPDQSGRGIPAVEYQKGRPGIDYDLSGKIVVGSENITLYARWLPTACFLRRQRRGERAGGRRTVGHQRRSGAASAAGMTAPRGQSASCVEHQWDGSGTNILPAKPSGSPKGDRTLYAVCGPEGVERR